MGVLRFTGSIIAAICNLEIAGKSWRQKIDRQSHHLAGRIWNQDEPKDINNTQGRNL